MPKYKIDRLDPVIAPGNQHPMPMLYVKPDKKFLDYAKENNYMVVATIEGTGTIYDGKPIGGVIDSSGYFPNLRPNFYNKTGYYVIILFAQWHRYPTTSSGWNVTLRGLKGEDAIQIHPPQPFKAFAPVSVETYEEPAPEKKCQQLGGNQIGWILTGILIVFAVLFGISFWKNGKNNTTV